jgi:hypothetical protein
MFCRAQQLAIAAFLTLAPCAAAAQIIGEPTPAALLTAENTDWFRAGDPIAWNGVLYDPTGIRQPFDSIHMVRFGSYKGIPLYTDPTVEFRNATSVFVPISGERVHRYDRRRTVVVTEPRRVAEVAATPPAPVPAPPPTPVGTSGRTVRVVPVPPVTTVIPPTGANTIWIEYDGRQWYAVKKSIAYDATLFNEVGMYHGWTVYSPKNDPTIIYIPSTPGRLAAYKRR